MFVLDASVIASWCFPDESHPDAEAALRRIVVDTAVVPTLLWFELRNVLLTAERRSRLTDAQTASFLKQLSKLPVEVDRDPDGSVVLALAREHRLTVYDAAYLELAQRRSVPLATLDSAIVNAAHREHIALIGEEA
jgi:predicted nucleic acid-binding protein